MAEQDFLNYASDDGGNVSVPRRLRTRPDSSEVELAYVTPEEQGILAALRPGTPHRGPMDIPNYDDYDVSTGTYRSGAAMSAAESSGPQNERMRADLRQAGISPQEASGIRRGAAAAAAMGQRGSGNFFGNIGGGIRNIGGGIRNIFGNMGNKLGAWAGKMRGGINPATGEYYTQDEYKDNVQARRDRSRIDRLRRTRDEGKYANDPRGWEASDLSGRLAGFEKDLGITGVANNINYPREVEVAEERIFPMKKPDQGFSGEGFMTKEQYDAAEVPEVDQGPQVIPTTWSERVGPGLGVDLQNVNYFGKPELEAAGAAPGTLWGGNKAAEAFQDYYDYATNPRNKSWMKQGITTPGELRKKGMQGAGLPTFPDKSTMEFLQDYPGYFNDPRDWSGGFQDTSDEPWPVQTSPNELLGIARGGIIGAF